MTTTIEVPWVKVPVQIWNGLVSAHRPDEHKYHEYDFQFFVKTQNEEIFWVYSNGKTSMDVFQNKSLIYSNDEVTLSPHYFFKETMTIDFEKELAKIGITAVEIIKGIC